MSDSKLKSRKLWVLVANVALVLLRAWGVDIDPEMLTPLQALSGAYMVGQGIADHGNRRNRVSDAAKGS